jgi:hypothetical protein
LAWTSNAHVVPVAASETACLKATGPIHGSMSYGEVNDALWFRRTHLERTRQMTVLYEVLKEPCSGGSLTFPEVKAPSPLGCW